MSDQDNVVDFALSPKQERIVEGMGRIFDDPANKGRITYSHSTLCQTSLPFKNQGDQSRWECRNGNSILVVRAGEVYDPNKDAMVQLGLPYGTKPRLILMDWNRQAMLSQSPEIEVEDSLYAFLKRLKLPTEGRVYSMAKKQLAALASCEMTMGRPEADGSGTTTRGHIVGKMNVLFSKDANQRVLWPNTVTFSTDYFESLMVHGVPLNEESLYLLRDSALELDLYAMLAERLHRVPEGKGQFVPWASLYAQYGAGYKEIRFFRRKFLKHLMNVKAVYHDANIDEVTSSKGQPQGLRFRNSNSPVPKLQSPVSKPSKS